MGLPTAPADVVDVVGVVLIVVAVDTRLATKVSSHACCSGVNILVSSSSDMIR